MADQSPVRLRGQLVGQSSIGVSVRDGPGRLVEVRPELIKAMHQRGPTVEIELYPGAQVAVWVEDIPHSPGLLTADIFSDTGLIREGGYCACNCNCNCSSGGGNCNCNCNCSSAIQLQVPRRTLFRRDAQ
jgi:hypothetical protein